MKLKVTYLLITLSVLASCAQVQTSSIRNLDSKIDSADFQDIKATFEFYPISKESKKGMGSFNMVGRLDKKSHRAFLKGSSWIKNVQDYDMVNLIGVFNKDFDVFGGSVEMNGCKQFSLKKIKKVKDSEIRGVWKGVYTCTQGLTGMTLTIN